MPASRSIREPKAVVLVLDALFLLAYLALAGLVFWTSRNLASGIIHLLFGTALTGSALALWGIPGWTWTYRSLQAWLALGLAATAAYAWLAVGRHQRPAWPLRRTLIALAPVAGLAIAFLVTRLMATDAGGPLTGVGYLVNHPIAEDNAKWLMASSQLAHGGTILQDYTVGSPLMMLMVAAATVISVASAVLYGGVNQVAVAADTLIFTQHALAMAAPLALAPLAFASWRLRRSSTDSARQANARQSIPTLALWTGMGALATTSILLTRYGHLTLQYTLIVLTLWVACFLAPVLTPRARLLTTLTVAACSQVWFPLNILATGLLLAALAWTITRLAGSIRAGTRVDWASPAFTVFLFATMFYYLRSSIDYTVGIPVTGSASAVAPSAGEQPAQLLPLFSIGGGTEVVTPIILGLAFTALLGSASFIAQTIPQVRRASLRWQSLAEVKPFIPVFILIGYTAAVALADYWSIGSGPGYGNKKLTFAITIVLLSSTIPLAITRLDLGRVGSSPARLTAVVITAFLLVADTLIPRALAEIRPQAWPADASSNYWSPAEVRPVADQPLARNPIGCVFLTEQQPQPSALPKGQLAYSCTRLLTNLAGLESSTGSLRQWLQTEWAANKPAWTDFYLELLGVAPDRALIVLDANANPTETATLSDLLAAHPPTDLPK